MSIREIGQLFGQNHEIKTQNDFDDLVWRTNAVAAFGVAATGIAAGSAVLALSPFTSVIILSYEALTLLSAAFVGTAYITHKLMNHQLNSFVIDSPDTLLPPHIFHDAKVLATKDSEETHSLRMEMIEKAEHNIILSGNFCGGHIFDEVLHALEKKLETSDVKVIIMAHDKFIIDQKNNMGYRNRTRINRMLQRFPNQFSYIPTNEFIHAVPGLKVALNHVKGLVTDFGVGKGRVLFGGSGVKDDFSMPGLDIEDGPSVSGLPKNTKQRFLQVCTNLDLLATHIDLIATNPTREKVAKLKQAIQAFTAGEAPPAAIVRHMTAILNDLGSNPAFADHTERLNAAKLLFVRMLKSTASNSGILKAILPRSFRDMDFFVKSQDGGRQFYIQMLSLAARYEALNQGRPFDLTAFTATPAVRDTATQDHNDQDSVTARLLKTRIPNTPLEDTALDADPRLNGDSSVKFFCQGPENRNNLLTIECIHYFNLATNEIVINHMFFHPNEKTLKALRNAVKRGVRVRIVSNGEHATSPATHAFFGPYNEYSYRRLGEGLTDAEKTLITVHHFTEHKKANHKKVIIIDGHYVITGSSNFGHKSTTSSADHEINAVIDSAALAAQTLAVTTVDQNHSEQVDISVPLSTYNWVRAMRHWLWQPLFG